MTKALKINCLVTNISRFAEMKDLNSFRRSSSVIDNILDPKSNTTVNGRFFDEFLKIFRVEDENEEDFDNKRKMKYRLNEQMNEINWEEKMKELNENKQKMEILGDKTNKVLDFIFRYHIYLPDLRKNNVHLEFINSSILMLKFYDYNKIERIQKVYYNKYITEEYMSDSIGNKKIIPLRERQYYEKELLNIRESFKEIKENKIYLKILTEEIMEYNYKLIEGEFKDMTKDNLEKINPIISFIYLIVVYFKIYLINVNASILIFKNKNEKFLTEFIKQHNDVINVILYINNNFNNANIIINYWFKFLNKENKDKGKNFSLLFLLLKMYKEYVFDSIIYNVFDEFEQYLKGDKIEMAKNKMIIDDEDEESLNSTNDSSYCSDEESQSEKEEPLEKKIIEEIGNCILDMEMNEQNANVINHSGIILGDIYQKYENILIESIKRKVERDIKEKGALKTFEEIKQLLSSNNNPRLLLYNNLRIINRTKKKLVEDIIKILVNYANNNFDINNKYYYVDNSIFEDLNDFSEESEKKIKSEVEKELKIIKNMLIKKNINLGNTEKIVNDYVDKNGDDIIILAKKVIFFYYKENQFYKDNNKKVIKILKGINNDSCFSFIDEKK